METIPMFQTNKNNDKEIICKKKKKSLSKSPKLFKPHSLQWNLGPVLLNNEM